MLLKRAFDIAIVCAGLPLFVPLMFIVAFVVKMTSKGPILFRQERIGWHETRFILYKFRTMINFAEKMGTSVTTSDDFRITPVGRKLRKMKLDELPQFLNVLKGNMSVVGPRPDVPEIVEKYTSGMKRIFSIPPGLTSLATLHLRDEEDILSRVKDPDMFYEEVLVPLKIRLAMEHVDKNSFAFDFKILCQTLWTLTLGRWWPIKEHSAVYGLKQRVQHGFGHTASWQQT
jgi:lipopolysaccharide/colanic/teichoic acid biosynthesis glycosyltransferase